MDFMSMCPANYTQSTFGSIVRNRREELGMSLRGFASEIGVTPAYISDIEHGKRYPPVDNANLMDKFTLMLKIPQNEIETFYDIAYFGKYGVSRRIMTYLANNKFAMEAVSLAEKTNISDSQWLTIISNLIASINNS